MLGAHIHHIEVMAPVSATVPNLDIVQVISPALSPIYGNNPGYGLLEVDYESETNTYEIEELTYRFF